MQRANLIAGVGPGSGEHLLRAAWHRAHLLEADLTICTAIGTRDAGEMIAVEAIHDRILASAPRDAIVRFDVRPGPASAQLLACARELGAAQILLGQAPLGPQARLAHTGVCTALLHEAACPVLVAGPRRGSRRILVATDLADRREPVLRAAAIEAARDGSAVVALHCLPPRPLDDRYSAAVGIAADELTAIAHERLAVRLAGLGLVAERRVEAGPIARAIVSAAIAHDVDLIVVGSHAHTARGHHARPGIDRLMCGTVADRVARAAPCSVLLVPVDDVRAT